MGPQGTGGLCINGDIEIEPLKVGGTGVQSFLTEQPREYPTRLEAGTLNGHGIAGLEAAADFISDTGVDVPGGPGVRGFFVLEPEPDRLPEHC